MSGVCVYVIVFECYLYLLLVFVFVGVVCGNYGGDGCGSGYGVVDRWLL